MIDAETSQMAASDRSVLTNAQSRSTSAHLQVRAQSAKLGGEERSGVGIRHPPLRAKRMVPDRRMFAPDAYVLGNEVGEPLRSIKTAWKSNCRRPDITGVRFRSGLAGPRAHQHGLTLPRYDCRQVAGRTARVRAGTPSLYKLCTSRPVQRNSRPIGSAVNPCFRGLNWSG